MLLFSIILHSSATHQSSSNCPPYPPCPPLERGPLFSLPTPSRLTITILHVHALILIILYQTLSDIVHSVFRVQLPARSKLDRCTKAFMIGDESFKCLIRDQRYAMSCIKSCIMSCIMSYTTSCIISWIMS